jgi:ubiquinol-cytochrome c reductase cytochrome c subunit
MRGNRFALMALLVAAPATYAQPGDAGRALFVANGCYECHGYVGQGGAAPRIAPTVYPYEAFARLVRRPANEMPAYAPQALGDDALRAIYAYLRSIPEPPPLADIAILR